MEIKRSDSFPNRFLRTSMRLISIRTPFVSGGLP